VLRPCLEWRTIRGMLPHKTTRGQCAFERFKSYEVGLRLDCYGKTAPAFEKNDG